MRYYIAVPKKIDSWSYQTLYTWKNYCFNGTYEEAIIKAIELFQDEGYLQETFIEDIFHYYGDDIIDIDTDKLFEAFENKHYTSIFKYASKYFIHYFTLYSQDYNKGILRWDEIDSEYMTNPNEDTPHIIYLN